MEGACERESERAGERRTTEGASSPVSWSPPPPKQPLATLLVRSLPSPPRRSRSPSLPRTRHTWSESTPHRTVPPSLPPPSVVVGAFPIQSMRRPHCGDEARRVTSLAAAGRAPASNAAAYLRATCEGGKGLLRRRSRTWREERRSGLPSLPPPSISLLAPFPYVLRLLFFPAVAAAQAKHGPIWLPRPMHNAMAQERTRCAMSTLI